MKLYLSWVKDDFLVFLKKRRFTKNKMDAR